jgi:hypothetical protein
MPIPCLRAGKVLCMHCLDGGSDIKRHPIWIPRVNKGQLNDDSSKMITL